MSHDPVSGIQRWECYDNHEIGKDDDGDYVTYADAEQAQAKAQAESYARGQRDERDRIRRGVMWLPMVGRLAGTDSTLSALHVLTVIDGADAVDEIGGYSFDEAITMDIAAIDAPCDCGTCRAIAADRLTRGKGSS